MRIVRIVYRLLFVLSVLTTLSACSKDDKAKEEKVPAQVEPHHFYDASQGLPDSGLWRHGIALFDLNKDGFLDILAPPPRKASEVDAHPFVWYGSENGVWRSGELTVPGDLTYGYGSIAVGDFNGDNISDVALAMHMLRSQVLIGSKNGKYVSFSEGLPSEEELTSRALTAADLNNDGKQDLIIVSEADFSRRNYDVKGVMVCYHDGEKWGCREVQKDRKDPGVFADQVATGDINGDGYPDIAVGLLATEKNQVAWLNDGKGGFEPFNSGLPKDKVYYSVQFGDINKDGKDDLVAAISGFGRKAFYGPRVFLSGPEGFSEYSDGLPKKESVRAITVGDIDEDGTLELICGTGKGGVKIFALDVDASSWKEMPVSGFPSEGLATIYGIYCADINNDGKMDVALNHAPGQDEEGGGIKVYLNGKAPTFKASEEKAKQ